MKPVMCWCDVPWVWLVGHDMGCGCDELFFASLLFCGFACSVLEKRETKRKREKEIEMMMNEK